jgi:hypothetical protein
MAVISGDRNPLDLRHAVNTTLLKYPSGTTQESLVVILHFLAHFLLQIRLLRCRFPDAAILLFLALKAETLRCAQRLRGTDGDGV